MYDKIECSVKENLKTAVKVYLVLLFFLLPLYMKNGFVMLGDVKYGFFRNMTLFFVLVTTVLLAAGWFVQKRKEKRIWSATDICVLCFGCSGVLSWCLSEDKALAWRGASGWYMGLLSQLLFVWIYFAVSSWYDGSKSIVYLLWAGAVLVISLGILNRYVFDPLQLMEGLGDWNREHLLSTIGNQNWYCGYVSVVSGVCFYYGLCGKGLKGAAGLFSSLLVFWTILTQGSEGGYLILLAQTSILFFLSLENRQRLLRFLAVMLCCPGAVFLGRYCIRFRGLMLVEDGTLEGIIFWKGWLWVFGMLAACLVILGIREIMGCRDRMADFSARKIRRWCLPASLVICVILFVGCQISDELWQMFGEKGLLRITDDWGNGRGILWRVSWGSYLQESIFRKLVGAGPDCFANVVYRWYPVNDMIHVTGQWETALYANAHNEWLNMLINQGILGLVSYAGIFVTLFVRLYRRQKGEAFAWIGMLAIAGYCAYGTVSFQQVLSTPLLFALMGMAEAAERREEESAFRRRAACPEG